MTLFRDISSIQTSYKIYNQVAFIYLSSLNSSLAFLDLLVNLTVILKAVIPLTNLLNRLDGWMDAFKIATFTYSAHNLTLHPCPHFLKSPFCYMPQLYKRNMHNLSISIPVLA